MQDKVIYVLEKLVRHHFTGADPSYNVYSYQPVCYVQNEKKAQDICRIAGKDESGRSYLTYSKIVDLEYYKKLGFKLREAK